MKHLLQIVVYLAFMSVAGCSGENASSGGHDHDHDHDHTPAHDHSHDSHGDHDHEEGHVHGSGEEAGEETHGSDEIVLAPEKAAAAGVATETVAPAPFHGVIKTSGRVMPASGDETTVSATVAGIVKLARPVAEGAEIGRGAPVVTISTSALPDGDISHRARIAYEAAKTEYERAQSLVADRIVSQHDFETAKAEYERARLAYEATGRGGNGRGVTVSTPADGFVKQLMVKDGDYVEVGQPIATVTKNRHLYLRAEVAERDYAAIRGIRSAKFEPAYSSGSVYDLTDMGGRLVSYGRAPGAGGAFIPVTFEFDNTGDILPDSYAEIYLIGAERPGVISVPVGALTEEQGVMFVYIQEDESCYAKREVKTGQSDGERVEILSGINPGDKVVTEGAVHVRLAAAGKSIPGHTHNH